MISLNRKYQWMFNLKDHRFIFRKLHFIFFSNSVYVGVFLFILISFKHLFLLF